MKKYYFAIRVKTLLTIGILLNYSALSSANTNCETSVYFKPSNYDGQTIKFIPLINQIYTKQKLDELLKKLKKMDQSSPDGQTYDGNSEWAELKEDEGIYGRSYVNAVLSFTNTPMVGGKLTRYVEEVPLMKARLRAYECHQRAGWPSAIDFSTSPINTKSPQTIEKPIEAARQPNNSTNADRGNTVTSKEELLNNCRNGADDRSLKGDNRIRFMRSCMLNSTEHTDREPSQESHEIIAAQGRMNLNDAVKAERSWENAPPNGKKVFLPDLGAKCLRTVDIKEDSDVRGMFWYALENICNEPIKAYWCDLKVCKSTNLSWIISPGGKERSWTSVRSGYGRHPNDLKGFACQLEYKGAPVYKDPKTHKCYAWQYMTR